MNGKENGKRKCEKCGKLVEHRFSVVLNGGNHWVCEDCLNEFQKLLGKYTIAYELDGELTTKEWNFHESNNYWNIRRSI